MAAPEDSDPGPDRPFRFLDLAAELRNNIYELTLTHDEQHDPPLHATTAFLRTCKQVYDEARDLFYARSTLHVTVELAATRHHPSSTTTRISSNGFDPTTRIAPPSLLEFAGFFPQHTTEIGTLKVKIRLIRHFETRVSVGYYVYGVANRFLYTLAHRYRSGKLELTLESQEYIESDGCTQWDLFWPIAKLKLDVELHLVGFEVETVQKIVSLRNNSEAAAVLQFDGVEDWHSFASKLNLRQSRPGVRGMDTRTAEISQSSWRSQLESSDTRITYDNDLRYPSTRRFLEEYFAHFVEIAKRGAPQPWHKTWV